MEEIKREIGKTALHEVTTERNPDLTKEKILDSARIEFSQMGLGGARVNKIANRAGVKSSCFTIILLTRTRSTLEVLRQAYDDTWRRQ